MAIITISHQMGTGGPEIGMALAKRLDYRYVDQDLISDAARRYGCVEERLSHLDESKPSLFERFDVETRRYITVIQTALLEFAETDDIVLMGRGGQWLLRGIPHVLRVRITERFEPRVRNWVRRTAQLTGETPNQRAATEFVRRDDNDRAGRMKYLYEVDISDPALYDVTLNAEKVSLDAAVQLIEGLVRRPEFQTTDTARGIVASRTLASRVQVALATHPETRKHRITVEATEGVVILEGATGALDHAVEVARSVPGVHAVRTRQVEIPPIPPFVA